MERKLLRLKGKTTEEGGSGASGTRPGAQHTSPSVGGGGCSRQEVGRVAGDSEEVEEVETHGESTMPLTT